MHDIRSCCRCNNYVRRNSGTGNCLHGGFWGIFVITLLRAEIAEVPLKLKLKLCNTQNITKHSIESPVAREQKQLLVVLDNL
jgi:hypothetical protein